MHEICNIVPLACCWYWPHSTHHHHVTNQAIASMPSTPRPTGAEGRGSTAPECLQVSTQHCQYRYLNNSTAGVSPAGQQPAGCCPCATWWRCFRLKPAAAQARAWCAHHAHRVAVTAMIGLKPGSTMPGYLQLATGFVFTPCRMGHAKLASTASAATATHLPIVTNNLSVEPTVRQPNLIGNMMMMMSKATQGTDLCSANQAPHQPCATVQTQKIPATTINHTVCEH
jgi:hypothetical protein